VEYRILPRGPERPDIPEEAVTSDPVASSDIAATRWRITALDTGTTLIDQSMLTYTVGVGTVLRIPRIMWLVVGPTTIVVDTSVPMRRRPSEFIGGTSAAAGHRSPRTHCAMRASIRGTWSTWS
jgi:hypothetical protein